MNHPCNRSARCERRCRKRSKNYGAIYATEMCVARSFAASIQLEGTSLILPALSDR